MAAVAVVSAHIRSVNTVEKVDRSHAVDADQKVVDTPLVDIVDHHNLRITVVLRVVDHTLADCNLADILRCEVQSVGSADSMGSVGVAVSADEKASAHVAVSVAGIVLHQRLLVVVRKGISS